MSLFERYIAQPARKEWKDAIDMCFALYDDAPICIGTVITDKYTWQLPVVQYHNRENAEVRDADIIRTHEFSSNCYIRFVEDKHGKLSGSRYYLMRMEPGGSYLERYEELLFFSDDRDDKSTVVKLAGKRMFLGTHTQTISIGD